MRRPADDRARRTPVLKLAAHEVARTASQYTTAIACESRGRAAGVLPAAWNILWARMRYGVGPRFYSLFEFARLPRAAWSDFVVDDPAYKRFLTGLSAAGANEAADDKARFHQHCLEHGLATIPILCVVVRAGSAVPPGIRRVGSPAELRAVLADAQDECFVKSIDGTFGQDAFAVRRDHDVFRYDGRSGSVDDLFAHIASLLDDRPAWLIQPRVRPHRSLVELMGSDALATVRVVTCWRDGSTHVLLALVKIVVGGNVTDNFRHGSTGNLVAAIDVPSGILDRARGSSRKDWPVMVEYPVHPRTGKRIEGFPLPYWGEVVRLVSRAQASLPSLMAAGWDVAITDEGPLLVEANARFSLDIHQVAVRRGLKRELAAEFHRG